MKNKICWMYFGKKRDRIRVVHMNKPINLGLAGMVTSKLFSNNIPIVVDETKMSELDAYLACFAVGREGVAPCIYMDRELFYEMKRGSSMARMILFHELGHYVNGDINPGYNEKIYEKEREELAQSGKVANAELLADAFAAKYLGKKIAVLGLIALKEKGIEEYGEDQLAIKELERRIEILSENK